MLIQVYHYHQDMTMKTPIGGSAKDSSKNMTVAIWNSNSDADFSHKNSPTSWTIAQEERRRPEKDSGQQDTQQETDNDVKYLYLMPLVIPFWDWDFILQSFCHLSIQNSVLFEYQMFKPLFQFRSKSLKQNPELMCKIFPRVSLILEWMASSHLKKKIGISEQAWGWGSARRTLSSIIPRKYHAYH